jgi:Contractile injection system tube protein
VPRNLDPRLIAFEARLERGAILRLEDKAAAGGGGGSDELAGTVLRFQYNPETITRTRTGKWEQRKKRKGLTVVPPQEVRTRSGQGSSALLAESEQISLKVVFDGTEAVLAGRSDADRGVLPELAFLEMVSTGREGNKGNADREAVQPIRPDELLLILGSARMFPVVLTSLTITEQKFLPTLVPLRAEVDLKLNVLEPTESAYRRWIDVAFQRLLDDRTSAAATAAAPGDVVAAIARELDPGGGS